MAFLVVLMDWDCWSEASFDEFRPEIALDPVTNLNFLPSLADTQASLELVHPADGWEMRAGRLLKDMYFRNLTTVRDALCC
jgi:hypothetical protein